MQGLIKGLRDSLKTWIWDHVWPADDQKHLGNVLENGPQSWQLTGCSVINLWASTLLDLFPSSWFTFSELLTLKHHLTMNIPLVLVNARDVWDEDTEGKRDVTLLEAM